MGDSVQVCISRLVQPSCPELCNVRWLFCCCCPVSPWPNSVEVRLDIGQVSKAQANVCRHTLGLRKAVQELQQHNHVLSDILKCSRSNRLQLQILTTTCIVHTHEQSCTGTG